MLVTCVHRTGRISLPFQVFWEVMVTVLGRSGSLVETVKNVLSAYQGKGESKSLSVFVVFTYIWSVIANGSNTQPTAITDHKQRLPCTFSLIGRQ